MSYRNPEPCRHFLGNDHRTMSAPLATDGHGNRVFHRAMVQGLIAFDDALNKVNAPRPQDIGPDLGVQPRQLTQAMHLKGV